MIKKSNCLEKLHADIMDKSVGFTVYLLLLGMGEVATRGEVVCQRLDGSVQALRVQPPLSLLLHYVQAALLQARGAAIRDQDAHEVLAGVDGVEETVEASTQTSVTGH